jgi:Tfp pilus assembly protein PilV
VRADESPVGAIRHAVARLGRDESGVGLIEVVVSAMLVVLVALSVYFGLDAASRASGVNKHRGVAAELAQQDQDRMRAMAVSQLSNYRETRSLRADGRPAGANDVVYTIASRAEWITDRSGTASCDGTDARANYLRISTEVMWVGQKIKPIDVQSLVAPPSGSFGPTQGSLAVQVNDRNGTGLAGVGVSLTGARNYTDATNATGCVLWGYLPTGNYTVGITRAGYVDPLGAATPTESVSVVGQATTTLSFEYDRAATIVASFDTTADGTTWTPTTGGSFSATSSALVAPIVFGTGARTTSITSTPLFPATGGYGVYAGNCAGASAGTQPVAVTPGGVTQVALHEPSINLKVVDAGVPVSGATVMLTGTGSGCGALPTTTTGANGFIVDRAQPFGTYTACTDFPRSSQTYSVRTAIDNSAAAGTPVTTLDRAAGAVLGACP